MDQEEKRVSATREYFRSREFKVFLYSFLLSLTAVPISLMLIGYEKIGELEAALAILAAIALPIILLIIFGTIIIFRLAIDDLARKNKISAANSRRLSSIGIIIPILLVVTTFVIKAYVILPLALIIIFWLILDTKERRR